MHGFEPEEIETAQRAWGDGVVAIGRRYEQGGDHKERAREHIAERYAYHLGPVVFKPTMAAREPFRDTPEGALSYFVGGNPDFPEDRGFALRPWKSVRYENRKVICQVDSALAMGNYFFTDEHGDETRVEYSFVYMRGPSGEVLIHLHHSSLPYSPPA